VSLPPQEHASNARLRVSRTWRMRRIVRVWMPGPAKRTIDHERFAGPAVGGPLERRVRRRCPASGSETLASPAPELAGRNLVLSLAWPLFP
jgi:hypothetical protein